MTRTRRLAFEGCHNFRDLGGYRTADGRAVRWGRVFRSDALHYLTHADAERLVGELGLATAIDLRTPPEIEAGGPDALAEAPVTRHRLSLIELTAELEMAEAEQLLPHRDDRRPEATAARYGFMLRTAGPRIAEALRILAEPSNHPAVFYCAAGKDRTGILAAVLLGALGVPDDVVVADYLLTAEAIQAVIDRLAATPLYGPGIDGIPRQNFLPHRETFDILLDDIRREFGGWADYARAQGLGDNDLRALRGALLE